VPYPRSVAGLAASMPTPEPAAVCIIRPGCPCRTLSRSQTSRRASAGRWPPVADLGRCAGVLRRPHRPSPVRCRGPVLRGDGLQGSRARVECAHVLRNQPSPVGSVNRYRTAPPGETSGAFSHYAPRATQCNEPPWVVWRGSHGPISGLPAARFAFFRMRPLLRGLGVCARNVMQLTCVFLRPA
jgi:hypothetical protein